MHLFVVLMLLGGLFGLSSVADTNVPVTIGFVPGQGGLVREAAQAQTFADLLAARLDSSVQLRMLDSEEQLSLWLSRYREVDCGWLGTEFLRTIPAGELLPLVSAESAEGLPQTGRFVVRQGVDAARVQRLRDALLAFGSKPDETVLLATLGTARFVDAEALPREERPLMSPVSAVVSAEAVKPQKEDASRPSSGAAPELPVNLAADRLDYDGETRVFHASGAAILQQGDISLAADTMIWQAQTRDAVASGSVVLTEPAGELRGDRLHANLGTGLGHINDGQIFLKGRNFHLSGTGIDRLGEDTYRVTDGQFTTCDGEDPDWQFAASQVDIDLGRFAVARDVWFEAGGQPLIYLPYMLFPVSTERQSGFLLPRAGYSNRKGAMLSLAWYEVIDRHLDATVYIDYLSSLGLGKGLDYRYVLGGTNRGEAMFYHVSGFNETPDSYLIDWKHEGTLPGGVRLAADVEYVNKKEFFEDFGEVAEDYNRDETVSTLLLQRNWEKLNLTGYARYIKDLKYDNDITMQRLPEFGLDVPFWRLDDYPLYSSTELRATNFSRQEGDDGQRLFLRQGLSMALKPGSWLEFTPEVALYGRAYHAESGDETDLLPEYSATLSTRLLKVFPFEHWGIERLQHSIEPQIRYVYVPNDGRDDLPFFDLKDRIGPLNQFEYALINRFTARSRDADDTPTYREVLNLRLSQAYDVREERDNNIDDPKPFSDLRTELTVKPTAASVLEIDALSRVYDGMAFSRLNAAVGYSDTRGNGGQLRYRYRSKESGFEPTDYLGLIVETALFAPVYLGVEERYDFLDSKSLENVLNLEYRAKCWSLFLTFRDRPDSNEILIGFSLSGLGQVGGFGSRLQPLD